MTKEELAARLTGREYTEEITQAEEVLAADDGLIIIFGASDDLCELRGAINDEIGAWDGAEVFISRDGKLLSEIENDDLEVLRKHGVLDTVRASLEAAIKVKALWASEDDYSWTFETDMPHATFQIMEHGEHYCRGIVISISEMRKP